MPLPFRAGVGSTSASGLNTNSAQPRTIDLRFKVSPSGLKLNMSESRSGRKMPSTRRVARATTSVCMVTRRLRSVRCNECE